MNKILLIVISCLAAVLPIKGQMTIEYCQEKARTNYPLIQQYGLIAKTGEYTLSNAGKGYLPQFSISGRASYQSNVTTLPGKLVDLSNKISEIPGIPDLGFPEKGRLMNKDQYNVGASVGQVIWDGGIISSERHIAKASTEVETKIVDTELYTINERINSLFFGILLIEKQLEQLNLYAHELKTNYDQVKSFVDNGVANESDLDVIEAAQYTNEQNKARLSGTCKAYRDMLSIMIGEGVGELVMPDSGQSYMLNKNIARPELQLFDARNQLYESQKKAVNAANMPRLDLFAHAGYGNPNFNLLKNKWDTYFIGGVSLVWNFGNLYSRKNDMKKIELNKQINESQRETFLFNTNLSITQEDNEIVKKRDMLKYDDKIIELRTNVKKAAQVKVENGIISVQELMREIDAEEMARESKILHEIDLLMSIYNHKYITNN
ncbi:MAG: TolC family protein [Dysgonomonas sp.]